MSEQEICDLINRMGCCKNTTVDFNKDKGICDIYTRCTLPQEEFLEKVAAIINVTVVPCDFGIFNLIIPLDCLKKTINEFVTVFSKE